MTQDTALESYPAWSRDWLRVAYTVTPHGRSGVSDLFVANADGSGAQRLTDDSASVRRPSFAGAGGDAIVFESTRGGKAQLYIINRNGTGRRQLTSGDAPCSQPDVSPDGSKLLFVSFREQNYDIYQMNLDGTDVQRLTSDPRPDEAPLYAADGRSFYYLQLDGGKPATKRVYRQELTPGAAPVPVTPIGMFVQAFSVSADGTTLVLTVLEPTPDGAGLARVSLFDVATQATQPLAVPGLDALAWPAFRPEAPAAAGAPAAPGPSPVQHCRRAARSRADSRGAPAAVVVFGPFVDSAPCLLRRSAPMAVPTPSRSRTCPGPGLRARTTSSWRSGLPR